MRRMCSTLWCCCTMRLLACSVLVLCLSACSGGKVIFTDIGASISLSCSSDGCPTSIIGDKCLYLYHELDEREEVLFFHFKHNAVPRLPYRDRIQINSSTRNFTISNLTVNDTGIYTCVYTKDDGNNIICDIYAVFIKEVPVPCELKNISNPSPPPTTCVTRQPLEMYIIFICVIIVLAMWIVFLLIIPRVKGWCERRRAQCALTVPIDNVYETMTKNQADPIPEAQTLSV